MQSKKEIEYKINYNLYKICNTMNAVVIEKIAQPKLIDKFVDKCKYFKRDGKTDKKACCYIKNWIR